MRSDMTARSDGTAVGERGRGRREEGGREGFAHQVVVCGCELELLLKSFCGVVDFRREKVNKQTTDVCEA